MIDKADKMTLLEVPAFKRFLFGLIQAGGIFDAPATEADGRYLYNAGRRSLAIDVLRELEQAQPEPHASGIPVSTAIQILLQEAQSAPKEKRVGGRNDQYRDLADDDE